MRVGRFGAAFGDPLDQTADQQGWNEVGTGEQEPADDRPGHEKSTPLKDFEYVLEESHGHYLSAK